ncbi:MAG: N-acetylmuramoyl-L-alanine amidase [Bacteroidales bacterium]|nr:N-acetylmuramoyl-L-alanine amidase [Bacteroidales bacterium]
MRTLNEIIIHCSATKEGHPFTVDDIRRWHKAQGYADIGYHYVIYLDGSVHAGRPIEQAGAHTYGHNAHSIGICYIGGLDPGGKAKNTLSTRQEQSLVRLIKELRQQFGPLALHGHNEYAAKACPSFDVQRWRRAHGL